MSSDLVEDVFANRPENDELAFLQYEKLFRDPLEAALANLQEETRDGYWDSYNHFMQTYINQVIAAVKALEIDILERWVNDPSAANEPANFRQIKYDIDAAITGIKIRYAQIDRKSSIQLDSDTRNKIRDLITKIKLTIESVDLPMARKEILMSRLNSFAAEVDRDRTRLAAFGALIVEVATGTAKVERKLRPIRKWLESVAGVMHEARALEDTRASLAAPSKRIQPPQRRISPPSDGGTSKPWTSQNSPTTPPKPKGTSLDDDIPF
jgi:hypothetical protein